MTPYRNGSAASKIDAGRCSDIFLFRDLFLYSSTLLVERRSHDPVRAHESATVAFFLLHARLAMSDLPKYQRIPDEEQAYGHTKLDLGVEGEGGAADGLDAAGVGPGYPPVASGTWRDPGQKKRIELCLVPRWPLRCKEEMALGTMGATRDVGSAVR